MSNETKGTKVIYWAISLTWGCIMTAIGAVAALVLIAAGQRPKVFHYNVYFEVGRAWGGVNFGGFFFVNKNASLATKQHEAGHGLQNLVFGPFMPFVVAIPSAIRCLIRKLNYRGKKIASAAITGGVAVIGIALVVLGIALTIPALSGIGALLAVYGGIIAYWLFAKEIPQYADGATVDYDAIWFEGSATSLGEKYFPVE